MLHSRWFRALNLFPFAIHHLHKAGYMLMCITSNINDKWFKIFHSPRKCGISPKITNLFATHKWNLSQHLCSRKNEAKNNSNNNNIITTTTNELQNLLFSQWFCVAFYRGSRYSNSLLNKMSTNSEKRGRYCFCVLWWFYCNL